MENYLTINYIKTEKELDDKYLHLKRGNVALEYTDMIDNTICDKIKEKLGKNKKYIIKKLKNKSYVELCFISNDLLELLYIQTFATCTDQIMLFATVENIITIDDNIFLFNEIEDICTGVEYIGKYDPKDKILIDRIRMDSTL